MRLPIALPAILLTAFWSTTAPAQNVNWSQVSTVDLMRFDHTTCFFEAAPGAGLTLLYGGTVGSTTTTDTFEFNGISWTQRFPAAAPPQRWSTAMAFDRLRRRAVLFGGHFSTNLLNDTWEWDGTNWALMATTGPAPRRFHAMAFDAARGRTVLFGGENGTRFSDTWEWDGATWTLRSPANSPTARDSHAMAYDLARQRLVLYGGIDNTAIKGDTWEWDGTNWTLMSTPFVSPGPQHSHSLTYDAARERTFFFDAFGGFFTYEWDGANWVRTFPPNNPPVGAMRQKVSYDELRSTVVFAHGGFAGTWDYAPVSPALFIPYGAGCPGTGGLVPAVAPAGLGELPWIGDSFVVRLSNLQLVPAQATFLLVGFAFASIDLTPLGAPGCFLLTSGDTTLSQIKPSFTTFVDYSIPIPNNPAFIGTPLFAQGAVLDPVNALGLVGSQGGLYIVGQR